MTCVFQALFLVGIKTGVVVIITKRDFPILDPIYN